MCQKAAVMMMTNLKAVSTECFELLQCKPQNRWGLIRAISPCEVSNRLQKLMNGGIFPLKTWKLPLSIMPITLNTH